MKIIYLFFISFTFSCITFQSFNEDIQRIIRRGSCIAFDIPAITLTPTKTAAERQLLGKDAKIETDGWLITSVQSTNIFSSSPEKKNKKPRRYYIELGILEYYKDKVNQWKAKHIIGESFDGTLRIVPNKLRHASQKQKNYFAKKVIQEVNHSRRWIYQYHLKEDPNNKENIYKKYLESYYKKSIKKIGEWIYTSKNKWELTS